MKYAIKPLTLLISSLILSACGGGGGSGSSSPAQSPSSQTSHTGYVIDGPVKGLRYTRNNSFESITPADGSFRFVPSETVRFYVGSIPLGTIATSTSTAFVTPRQLANNNETARINIGRFLITLDADRDPTNGIQLNAAVVQAAEKFSGTVDFRNFDGSVLAEFARTANNDGARELVSKEVAKAHIDASEADIADGQYDYDSGTDADGDGVNNAVDQCPNTPTGTIVNANGCVDQIDENQDSDNDGILNGDDNCPDVANPDQFDLDGDQRGDACDADADGDGIIDEDETDTDPLNPDTDGDGFNDGADNCPSIANAEQTDTDLDGLGDACDDDIDNDGVPNNSDAFPYDPTESKDNDLDGIGDNADDDDDNDGVKDEDDAFPFDPKENKDTDGDGIGDNTDDDDDGDGVKDEEDAFPFDPNESNDSDGDGVGDKSDSCPATAAGDPANNTGCSAAQFKHASCSDEFNLEGNRSYQVVLPVADTDGKVQRVSFQIMEPTSFDCANINRGAHPLMIHGPGYSGSRSTSGFANYRNDGYTVISWDPRGFGDSSGTAKGMDPEYEGRYLIAILDWVEQNLDYLAWRNEASGEFIARPSDATSVAGGDNLLIGSQGGSYGGGYQLLTLAVDSKKRLDAIAPDITWHDLRDALNPGDVVKTVWGAGLAALGTASGSPSLISAETFADLQAGENVALQDGQDPFIQETVARSVATNEWPRQSLNWFAYRGGLGAWCKASGLPTLPYPSYGSDTVPMLDPSGSNNTPTKQEDGRLGFGDYLVQADDPLSYFDGLEVLLTQGMIDTLFNYNQAWWNYQCLSAAGAKVSLYTHNGGHVLPGAQSPDSPSVDAGSCGFYTSNEQKSWFDARLKPLHASPSEFPANTAKDTCFALGTANDVVKLDAQDVIAPGASNKFTRRTVTPVTPVPNGPSGYGNLSSSLPVYAPLGVVEADTSAILAGIPHLTVTVTSVAGVNETAQDCSAPSLATRSGCDSITFVGIGKKAPFGGPDSPNYVLIDDQVQPIRGLGEHDIDLVGIAERINDGDELAVLFYAVHPQFASSASRDLSVPAVTISGTIALPLYVANETGQADVNADTSTLLPGTDPDTDGDGVLNESDACPNTPAGSEVDEQGCSSQQRDVQAGLAVCTPDGSRCISTIPELGAPLQAAADQIYAGIVSGGAPLPANGEVILHAAQAQVQGCDMLDPAHCLFPFPSNQFTSLANAGSVQSSERGGSGRKVNFNILGMPRNTAGKPIDPSEWNRNDGFSPGQMITTFVPDLAANEDGTVPGAPRLSHLSESLDLNNSAVLVLDAETGEPHPVWAEIDLNAGLLFPGSNIANPDPSKPARAALIIRPARNFEHGRRYVVVLRQLPSATSSGEFIKPQPAFRACRDQQAEGIPVLADRCATWDSDVRPVLNNAGIPINNSDLYLAWDFTVASSASTVGRLRHMRDTAFATLGQQESSTGEITDLGNAPTFTIDKVTDNPGRGMARRIEGTITVPSFVTPADPAPVDNVSLQAETLCSKIPEENFRDGCNTFFEGVGIADGGAVPPNRLFYQPDQNGVYGDELPDSVATMTTRFTCQIPAQASSENPARAGIYGHGLLDGHQAVTYDQVPEFSNDHNFLFCGVDLFGFSTGDVANVVSILLDLSNFATIPDASQQGLLNYLFLARALRHENGFGANEAFQLNGKPVFDNSEIFYDGNSQGGIIGGAVVAMSKDVQRGVLGVVGMNYSTLLRRSVDFDSEFKPTEPGLPPYAMPLYLSYPDDLDRDVGFALMQMLWDRSENNGYAHHIADNSDLHGPDNQVLLQPAFADHQVTHWSAQVMARTIGVEVADIYQRAPGDGVPYQYANKEDFLIERDPDVEAFWGLNLDGRDGEFYDSLAPSFCLSGCRSSKSGLIEFDEGKTVSPPIGNVAPRGDHFDPHGYPRGAQHGKCQKSHFLHKQGRLIDTRHQQYVRSSSDCPQVPAVSLTVSEAKPSEPGDAYTEALNSFAGGLGDAMTPLGQGDFLAAANILQSGSGALIGDVVLAGATQAGSNAGMIIEVPAEPVESNPDAGNPPAMLMAGTARKSILIPVGASLGGYARPPVGGDYIPVAEKFEDFPDINPADGFQAFVDEFADFLPAQDHDGHPLPSVPDELRAIHSPYSTYSPPSQGYYDSLIAKAVSLYDGSDCVIMVKTDFIGMLDEVVIKVAEQATELLGDDRPAGCDIEQGLVMSATHTHDGPGTLANHSTRYFWLAMDLYQPELFKRIVRQLAELVAESVRNNEPAQFGYAMGSDEQGLNGFRRSRSPYTAERVSAQDILRKRIGVLRIDDAQGQPLAAVINFAAHGIAFDVENLHFSGDVLAGVEREVEQQFDRPMVAMLVQSAAGDVSPRNVAKPKLQGIERYGQLMAPQVMGIYNSVNNFNLAPDIRVVSQRVILSREKLGYSGDEFPYEWGAAQCNADFGVPIVGPSSGEKIPACLPAPTPDPMDLADNGVAENGAFVPQDTRITAFSIGDALFLAQPGEAVVEQGLRLLEAAEEEGFQSANTFIWGYSQDHVGYILPDLKADWDLGGTEGTTTFWGWKLGGHLLNTQRELIRALRDGSAAPTDEFTVNYDLYGAYYDSVQQPAAIPGSGMNPLAQLQPQDIKRFETAYFSWEGNDAVLELPTVILQRQNANGEWLDVQRGNGEVLSTLYEIHLDYRLSLGAHLWTATLEANKDWPLGTYRFHVIGQQIDSAHAEYEINSASFAVNASDSLIITQPEEIATDRYEVSLAYTPRPDNYRLIDAQVDARESAPVRAGSVVFSNGDETVVTSEPLIVIRDGKPVAVYQANITDLGNGISVSGSDVYGNVTAQAGTTDPVIVDGRGSGLTGTIANFFAAMSTVIQDFLSGNTELAQRGFELAFNELTTGLQNFAVGDSNSLSTALAATSSDEQSSFETELGNALGLGNTPSGAIALATSAERRVEPVVLTGAQLPGWSVPAAEGVAKPYPSGVGEAGGAPGMDFASRDAHNGYLVYPATGDAVIAGHVPVSEVAAYRYDPSAPGDGFVEIPVQVDERMPYFLANANSDFSFYSATDPELSYVWDREMWNAQGAGCNAEYPSATPDPIPGIDNDDEIVFMASDAGEIKESYSFRADWKSVQIVTLLDPLQPEASPPKAVYLVQKTGGSSFNASNGYVNYQRNADADQWVDRGFFADDDPEKLGSSNTGYGPNVGGSVCDDGVNVSRISSDRFPRDGTVVSTDTYRWEASGRWMVRDIRIKSPNDDTTDSNYWQSRPDLIDRWKGRAFQQSPDSTVSLVGFEDEQVNWEANSTILGERQGAVRAIREVWGADSGTNVTKTESFYKELITYRYRIRVHPIPPDGLYTSWDYNRAAMVPAADENVPAGRYYTVLRPQGVPVDGVNDDFGQIDSLWGSPAFFDAPDPSFNLALGFENWEQVSGKGDSGSLVYIFELKNAQALANPLIVPYYRDDACLDDGTGDDPVARPWPGEESTDLRVQNGYEALNDYTPYASLRCDQRQGAFGAHGIHYFFTHDSDNAFTPAPVTEIDGQQWQFMVPSAAPQNVAEPYANTVRSRLVPVVINAMPSY